MTIPVISTGHVRQETFGQFVGAADYLEGAFVNVEVETVPEMDLIRAWMRANYPNQHWVRLDRDGDQIEGLPHFEW
jgi:hypothetical protein